MANTQVNPVLQHIRRMAGSATETSELSDRELLERFTARHEEAVFEALVRRHGPLVLSVCRRVLNQEQDAEDIFQATFLVLARKAESIRKQASLGSWLFGVAYRLALKARASAARRHAHERRFAAMAQTEVQPDESLDDLRALLDQELHGLPEKYRAPLVLCYLEGKTHLEAAQTLGWPSGSMSKRLEQGRELLRLRLGRRGVVLSGVAICTSLADSAHAALPPALVSSSVKAGVLAATGQALAGTVSVHVAAMAEGVLKTMFMTKVKLCVLALLGVSMLTAGVILAASQDKPDKQPAKAEQPQRVEASVDTPADLALVPGESLGFMRLAISDIWNLPALKQMRQQAGTTTTDLLRRAEKALGVPIDAIDKVTLIALGLSEHQEPYILGIFTTTRPYARDKVQKALVPDGTETKHNDRPLVTGKNGVDTAVYFVSDHMFVLGDPRAMQAYLELKPDAKTPPSFGTAVKLASGKHHIVGWIHLPQDLAATLRQQPLPEAVAFLRPLMDLQSGSVVVDLAGEARMRINLRMADEDAAKQAIEATQTGIASLKELLDNLPDTAIGSDALVGLFVDMGKQALASCRVVREQSSVVLTAQTKATPLLSSVIPGIAKVRASASRMKSSNNLKQIALAMHNYHDTYGHFPPAAILDKDGKPLLSWRVAILPFIEQDGLYKEFHLDEPWDSEHNKKLIPKMPKVYALVNVEPKDPHTTIYKVFTGKSTVFEDPNGIRIADIADGTSNTFLVVEGDGPVPWSKPEDLPFDPEQKLPKLGGQFDEGFLAAFCDGSVRFMSNQANENLLRALITRNGGEKIDGIP